MRKTRSKILCALAALLGAFFVLFCVAGFAACGGSKETTRFEAEQAQLSADESDMMAELSKNIIGNYIEPFVFNVQEDENASGGKVVGYLCESSPSITFNITASAAKSATLTLRGASAYLSEQDLSNWMGLAAASILEYKGSEHDILKVNGESVALSGSLPGAESVFDADFNLNVSNWGEMTAKFDLKEGENQIVITYDNIGLGVDYIEIETAAELTYIVTDNSGFSNVPSTTEEGPTTGPDDDTPDYSDRFVIGAYNETTSTKDYYYYKDSVSGNAAYFTGSEVTSVTYEASADSTDGIDGTYTINGKAANMDAEQLPAFWGAGANEHTGAIYITVTLLAQADEEITVYTEKSPQGISLNGSSSTLDDTFFTRIQDVTNYDGESGSELYTFSDGEGTYSVVLGEIVKYDPVKLEAEDAAWINTVGKTNSYISGTTIQTSGVIDTEVLDEAEGITSVKFFKTGDQLVFAVYSDEAVSNVTIAINAASAATISYNGSGDFTDLAEGGLLTVNGTVTPVAGTLEYDSNKVYHNWSELTATISLIEGVNYFVITCGSTSINVDGITLYCGNVDLNEVLSEQDVATDLVYISDSMEENATSLKLEAEDAGLFNTIGKQNTYVFGSIQTSGVMDTEMLDDVTTSIKFFKEGDQIVFAVYSDDAVNNVSITINAATASTTSDVTMTSESGIISVNGEACTVSGTLSANGTYYNWGELTVDSTVSLIKGVNYIVLTCGSTSINVDGITLTFGTASPET